MMKSIEINDPWAMAGLEVDYMTSTFSTLTIFGKQDYDFTEKRLGLTQRRKGRQDF
jgi:hypothetical protein